MLKDENLNKKVFPSLCHIDARTGDMLTSSVIK